MKVQTLHVVPSQQADFDAELLVRIARGEPSGLGELYDRYARELWSFAHRAAPRDDAEEIVRIVFERLLRAAASSSTRRTPGRIWLFGMAARVLGERRRSLRRFVKISTKRAPVNRALERPASSKWLEVEWALGELSHRKRLVFLLAEVEGFTALEIAEALRTPTRIVWTRLHQARRELRALLEGEP
jgi:RNA polymerase sigma-70 factor (ECF subfamily)